MLYGTWLKRWRITRLWSMLTILLLAAISSVGPQNAMASPGNPGDVPSEVGEWTELRHTCEAHGNAPWVGGGITASNCMDRYNAINRLFKNAYRESERDGVSPGYPNNDVHFYFAWNNGPLIQDFWYGNWGDGALIMGTAGHNTPHYVGGGAWNAYKRAVHSYGVSPGYPINTEHNWGAVRIQDFRGGAWGDGAIIGGGNAELVAGNHWEAYIKADGSNRLRNPLTFVNHRYGELYVDPFGGGYWISGYFWVQEFEGGQIWERNGAAYVWFYDTGTTHQVH